MLQFAVYFAIAAFIAVAVLGHILVIRAIFAQTDHVSSKRDKKPARGYLGGYGA